MNINEVLNDVDVSEIDNSEELEEMLSELETYREAHCRTLSSAIEDLDYDDKIRLYDACFDDGGDNVCYYYMSSLNEHMKGKPFVEAFNSIDTDNFDTDDDVFWYDNASYVVSGTIEDFLEANFDADAIAEWAERHDYDVDGLGSWKDHLDEIDERIEEFENRLEEL